MSNGAMTFDTKIAVVLRYDLEVWQKLNVTAFLVSGIAGTVDGLMGLPLRVPDPRVRAFILLAWYSATCAVVIRDSCMFPKKGTRWFRSRDSSSFPEIFSAAWRSR